MLIIGLTGSIGMGKSTVAGFFRDRGIGVFDADAEVHKLYEGRAAELIEKAFPGTTKDGRVDRKKLVDVLMVDPQRFKCLEEIVHPLVQSAEKAFLEVQSTAGARMAILEIPLLFETGRESMVDVTVVVSARPDVQRRRVLERPGMTPAKLENLLARQTSDAEKRCRADFVVDTGASLVETETQVAHIIETLGKRKGRAFQKFWQ